MNVVITGASGFLGRNLILRAPADWRIVAVYHRDESFPAFVREHAPAVTIRQCDLGNPAETAGFADAFDHAWDCCIYLAAKVDIPWSVREPAQDLQTNTGALLNFLDAVHSRKFIYFSSGAVYDGAEGEVSPATPVNPTLPYAISKLACERYVDFYRARRRTIEQSLIVRFFGAFGPYEAPHKIYTRLLNAFAFQGQRRYALYGDGSNLIDAMYVEDAVEAVIRMACGDHWNDTLNLAYGRPLTIESLIRQVAEVFGVPEVDIEKTGIAHESNRFWGSTAELRRWYDFTPRIGLAEGMRKFCLHAASQQARAAATAEP